MANGEPNAFANQGRALPSKVFYDCCTDLGQNKQDVSQLLEKAYFELILDAITAAQLNKGVLSYAVWVAKYSRY